MTQNAYHALALQARCHAVNGLDVAEARAQMLRSIERLGGLLSASLRFIGSDCRLVVLPEYVLTGFPAGEDIAEWRAKAAIDPDGREYDALSAIAARARIFLAGNAYETDPGFPGLYFQSSFLIDPAGTVVLRYRRLISLFAPTPHDVWDRYFDRYGLEGVFPVADTAIGCIACVASEEILYPEVTRAMALRGAELIVHSTGEAGSAELTPKEIARRARAFENMLFVVSANAGGIESPGVPAASTDGMSTIVDYKGRVLVKAGFGESMVANAEIDLGALRRWRRRPGMENVLSRQRTEPFAALYSAYSVYPANTLDGGDRSEAVRSRSHFRECQRQTIQRLIDSGVFR